MSSAVANNLFITLRDCIDSNKPFIVYTKGA